MIQKIKHILFWLEWTDKKNQFSKIKNSLSSDLVPSGPDSGRQVKIASPGGSCRWVEVAMPGRCRAPGGCATMEDGAEGSVEAARVEAVVGASGGGSHGGWSRCRRSEGEGSRRRHGGWRRGSVKNGGAAAAVEKGAATIDPEKGVAAAVEEGGGCALASDVLASDILALLPVSCTHGIRRPHVRRPRVITGEMYSRLPAGCS
jgi:hypothetical protein